MRLNAKDFGIVKEAVVTGVPMLVFMATNFVKAWPEHHHHESDRGRRNGSIYGL